MRTDCADIREALSLLLAGELEPQDSSRVAEHLASCEACARLENRLRRSDALLRAAPGPAISSDELKLMLLRARSQSASSGNAGSSSASGQAGGRRFLAAAALIGTLIIPAASYFLFDSGRSGPPGCDAVATVFDVDVDF
jgi:anti-sigma factor RsiW